MNYRLTERSVYGLKPIECYEFVSDTTTWRYTSADEDVVLNSETYTAIPIKRKAIEITQDIHKSDMDISVPKDNDIALQVLLSKSDEIITLSIYRYQEGFATDYITYWKGRVAGVKMQSPSGDMVLECESAFTAMRRIGTRLRDTKLCNAALYDTRCGVDKAGYLTSGTVATITSQIDIVVDAAAGETDGYFTGGVADFSGVYRYILNHSGSSLRLTRPVYGLEVSDTVNLYPGCDRRHQTCIDKFNNLPNFRGAPWIPDKNPFDGKSIV